MRPHLFALTLSLTLSLAACGDKSDDTAGSGPVTTSFVATVDGAAWESSEESAYWNSFHADSLSFQGAPTDLTSGIVVNIAGYSGAGTYALGTDPQTMAQFVGGAMSSEPGSWDSVSGEVVITSDNGTAVTGTLSFDGVDASTGTTKVITAGSFALNPQE